MKGFELIHNDQIVTASIENGVTSILLSKINNNIHLYFRGLDSDTNRHLTWLKSIVKERDIITINVIDVNQAAEVIESKLSKRNSLENKLIEYK